MQFPWRLTVQLSVPIGSLPVGGNVISVGGRAEALTWVAWLHRTAATGGFRGVGVGGRRSNAPRLINSSSGPSARPPDHPPEYESAGLPA